MTHHLTPTLALQLFQVMRLGTAIFTGIILAKSGLSVAEIGAWEMLLYLSTILTFFWVSGLLQGIAPVYGKLEAGQHKTFVFNHFLLFCGISILLFILMWTGEQWITPALTGLDKVPYFKWFAVYLLFNLPSFPVEYWYLLKKKPINIITWGIVSFGLYLLALILPIYLGMGLEGGIKMLVLLGVGKWLWAAGMTLRYGELKTDTVQILRYLAFCAPLMLSNVVSNLLMLFDNWLVGWHYGDPAVFAIYRYGAREFPLATALVSALGTSLIPQIIAEPEKGLNVLKQKTRQLMHLLFPMTMVLMCLSKPLFPWIFNAEFAASAALFNIYLLTLASRILLPTSVALAKGDSKSIFHISLFELVVKFVLGFFFLRWWGLPGLAFSVVLSFWVEKIGLIWILEKKHGVKTSDWLDWKWYLSYCLALFGVYWLIQSGWFGEWCVIIFLHF